MSRASVKSSSLSELLRRHRKFGLVAAGSTRWRWCHYAAQLLRKFVEHFALLGHLRIFGEMPDHVVIARHGRNLDPVLALDGMVETHRHLGQRHTKAAHQTRRRAANIVSGELFQSKQRAKTGDV